MSKGGAMPGAGRPKGALNESTKQNLKVQKTLRAKILKSAGKLYRSQMALAGGCSFLYKIEIQKKGGKSKPILVEDAKTIEAFLRGEYENKDDEYYFITTEKPDGKAIDSMLDRVFGKAQQTMDVTTDGEKIDPLSAVLAAVSGKTAGIPKEDK